MCFNKKYYFFKIKTQTKMINLNKLFSYTILICFMFCFISLYNPPKAEAYIFQDTIESIYNFFNVKNNNDYDNTSNNVDVSENDEGLNYDDTNDITDINESIKNEFNAVNSFSLSNNNNKGKNNKEKYKFATYLIDDNDLTGNNVETSSDYSFDITDINNISSLFNNTDDNNIYQNEYDNIINNSNLFDFKYDSSYYNSDENQDDGILASIENLSDSIGATIETTIASISGIAIATITAIGEAEENSSDNNILNNSYSKYKDEKDSNIENGNDNSDDNDNAIDSNNDDITELDNDLEGNNSDTTITESYYRLSNSDYAIIKRSIKNLPNLSNLCEPTMLSTIKNFITTNNNYWKGDKLDSLASCIIARAEKYNLNPIVICAQLKQESEFTPTATSPSGALGIAQFMPATASSLNIEPLDVEEAIDGQCKYMSNLMSDFNDYSLALAGYNAGAGAVQKYGGIPPYSETQNYVAKITSMIDDLNNEYNKNNNDG